MGSVYQYYAAEWLAEHYPLPLLGSLGACACARLPNDLGTHAVYHSLLFLLPYALIATALVFVLRGRLPLSLQRLAWLAQAAWGASIYVRAYVHIARGVLYEPTYTVAYDLYGDTGRALVFIDAVAVTLVAMVQIAVQSHDLGVSYAWAHVLGCLVGVGHPLWMVRADGARQERPLRTRSVQLWALLGTAVYMVWFGVAYEYFAHFESYYFAGNGYGFGNTPSAQSSLMLVTWATLEWLPYFTSHVRSFWFATALCYVNFVHVATYVCLVLFLEAACDVTTLDATTYLPNGDRKLLKEAATPAAPASTRTRRRSTPR